MRRKGHLPNLSAPVSRSSACVGGNAVAAGTVEASIIPFPFPFAGEGVEASIIPFPFPFAGEGVEAS